MSRLKKSFLLLTSVILSIFVFCSCASSNNKSNDKVPKNLTINAAKNTEKSNESNLKENITLLSADSLNCGDYTLSIVGATLQKSEGDATKDSLKVGCGLKNESVDESTARGFALGFYNSKAEIKKKDAYLCLYLKFQLNDKNKTQRDSVIPDVDISAKDNKNDKLDLIYYSNKDKYIDLQYPNGVVILKTYSDSQSFEIKIKDTTFTIDSSILK